MIKFFQAEYEAADSKDLISYLLQNNYTLIKEGREYHLKEHDSLKINDKNKWYWYSKGIGGGIVQFLTQYEGYKTVDAVNRLLGGDSVATYTKKEIEVKTEKEKLEFTLPEKNENYRRVFAYLNKTRKIDAKIIEYFLHNKLLYESKDTHNAIFLGLDNEGNVKHGFARGTNTFKIFRGELPGSDKRYSFSYIGKNNILKVFESPIDLFSDMTFEKLLHRDWQKDHRVSLDGVNSTRIESYLKLHFEIDILILCLDNDVAGKEMVKKIKERYATTLTVVVETPVYKDVNEDLIALIRESEEII